MAQVLGPTQPLKHFLILGLFNNAVPFTLFAWAAQILPASLESVLNATAPIWGAILGAAWTRTLPSPKAAVGLLLGIVGVAVLVGLDAGGLTPQVLLAAGGALLAAGCYAVAALYSKGAKSVDAFSNAHGSMWGATLLMAPAALPIPGGADAMCGCRVTARRTARSVQSPDPQVRACSRLRLARMPEPIQTPPTRLP